MYQVIKTRIEISDAYANIIGHECYAASKLSNQMNYERRNWKELGLEEYPDWYYQKKVHKKDFWYKQLPSQTAQEVCKDTEKSYKSYFRLKETGGVENPGLPRFKQEPIAIKYMQNGIHYEKGSDEVRLTIASSLKKFMKKEYGIDSEFIYLKNQGFREINGNIKQIMIYPPKDNVIEVIINYEIGDVEIKEDNGRYLSIDPGIHNPVTGYNSATGETFIAGREYASISRYHEKEIGNTKSQWMSIQSAKGVKYPKATSEHIRRMYAVRNNQLNDYLHKLTRNLVNYCIDNDINTMVIGNLKHIRENTLKKEKSGTEGATISGNELRRQHQNLHSFPFDRLYDLLEYKCAKAGIRFVKQNEMYSSQCSPLSPAVSKKYAAKDNRKVRGMYIDGCNSWNADVVGAFNILRLYLKSKKKNMVLDPMSIHTPYIRKVAV